MEHLTFSPRLGRLVKTPILTRLISFHGDNSFLESIEKKSEFGQSKRPIGVLDVGRDQWNPSGPLRVILEKFRGIGCEYEISELLVDRITPELVFLKQQLFEFLFIGQLSWVATFRYPRFFAAFGR